MKEDVIIIHGYRGNSMGNFFPWLKEELEEMGNNVFVPDFPGDADPHLIDWLKIALETIEKTENPLVLIGHSLGGALVLHLLEKDYEWQKRLRHAYILGSPAYMRDKAPDFYDPPINWVGTRKFSGKLTAIWSKDDPLVPGSHIETIKKETGCETIVLNGFGHFMIPEFQWFKEKLAKEI